MLRYKPTIYYITSGICQDGGGVGRGGVDWYFAVNQYKKHKKIIFDRKASNCCRYLLFLDTYLFILFIKDRNTIVSCLRQLIFM